MSSISDSEPSSFEEADKLQVWKDAMLEEYRSILKNNVSNIVRTLCQGQRTNQWSLPNGSIRSNMQSMECGKVQSKICSHRLHSKKRN
jgi:hypothetical protein